MSKVNFFFQRKTYSNQKIKKPFYEYKGYFIPCVNSEAHYPLVLTFGKNRMDFLYREESGKTLKVFSLYMAEGDINQELLTKKIENYWKMPLWPLNQDLGLCVNSTLLSLSYFSSWNEFDYDEECEQFSTCKLFKRSIERTDNSLSDNSLTFKHQLEGNPKPAPILEVWDICKYHADNKESVYICTDKINFRKILLDFLYELDYANTFEDENFFELQVVLQNNKMLDAISRKCRYLDELYKLRNFERTNSNQSLPKQFIESEKDWLNVCFKESYSNVFASADSVFATVEHEAELATFSSVIGVGRRHRKNYFNKRDSSIRNQLATFFLRQYSMFNAFNVLIPKTLVCFLPLLLLLIPFGDLLLSLINRNSSALGIFSIGLPCIMMIGLSLYYPYKKINLFKLLMPRLSLGVLIGWSVFMSSGDLWKAYLMMNWQKILLLFVVLSIVLFFYIFTDIRNKLIRVKDCVIVRRTLSLILFAVIISLAQGYYVIQFFAEPIYDADYQFLQTVNKNIFEQKSDKKADDKTNVVKKKLSMNSHILIELGEIKEYYKSDKVEQQQEQDGPSGTFNNLKSNVTSTLKSWPNSTRGWVYDEMKTPFGFKLFYMWPVLLTQFMLSIIIGVVLQLLWEDRPITEPL